MGELCVAVDGLELVVCVPGTGAMVMEPPEVIEAVELIIAVEVLLIVVVELV